MMRTLQVSARRCGGLTLPLVGRVGERMERSGMRETGWGFNQ